MPFLEPADILFRDLAFIGAAITVLSLLFNTLAQNSIITQVRSIPDATSDERPGAIHRSTQYDNSAPSTGNTDTTPDLSTLAAMYTGMLSSNVSDLPVSCPTGNCTWPVVPSLGVCGACMDVTSTLVESCSNASSCTWSIPGGAKLSNPGFVGDPPARQPSVFIVAQGPGKIWNTSEPSEFPGDIIAIYDFNVIGQSRNVYDAMQEATPVKLPGVKAYECGLWFCLQARHTNVSFGITEQGVAATWNQAVNPLSRFSSSNFTKIPENFNPEPGVIYGVSGLAQQAATTGISDILFGTVNAGSPVEVAYTGTYGGNLDGLKGLWYAADDIYSWMDNLAQSMSNNVRLTGTTNQLNDTLYDGVAWAEEVYIEVQWVWMIYPFALLLMAIGFLLLTIVENRKQRPWKNSASAMLYTRLDNQLQEEASKADAQNRGLTEDFDRTAVRLNTQDWTFRPVSVR